MLDKHLHNLKKKLYPKTARLMRMHDSRQHMLKKKSTTRQREDKHAANLQIKLIPARPRHEIATSEGTASPYEYDRSPPPLRCECDTQRGLDRTETVAHGAETKKKERDQV